MDTNYSWFTQPSTRNRGSSKPNPDEISLIDSLSSWFLNPAQNNRGMSTQEANQQYNPPSIQNGKLVAGTPMEGSIPQLQPQIANAFDGVAQMNLDHQQLQNTNDPFSSQALKQLSQQEITQRLFPNSQTQQLKTNILGEQIPMNQLPKGSGYVNGKLFDSNKQSPQGMFTGYSKERDASLDSYGKVDKNSDFYKRNKKAMENL